MRFPWFGKKQAPVISVPGSGVSIFFMPTFSGIINQYELIRTSYFQNPTVNACVRLISQSVAQLEPYLIRQDGEKIEEISSHEILSLISRPSQDIPSGAKFFETLSTYLLLTGNCYIFKARDGRDKPGALFFLPPQYVRIETNGQNITRYIYQSGGYSNSYDPGDIIHIKEINPLDPFRGMSRLEAVAGALGIENMAIRWNAGLLEHGGRLSGVFTPQEPLTEIQKKRLEEAFANFSGYMNAGKTPILPFNLKYEELGVNPKDLDYINAIKLASRKICAVFGVPAELLGDAEAKTYSNYQEARKSFWLDTIIPLAKNIYSELNAQLLNSEWPGEDLRLTFDADQIDAIQENRREKYDYINQAWWISLNEKRQATGYGAVPGGDYLFVPSSLIPTVRTDGGTQGETEEEERAAEYTVRKIIIPPVKKFNRWKDRNQRDLLWNHFVFLVKKKEKSFRQPVERFLSSQVQRAINKISGAGSVHVARDIRFLDIEDEAKKYFDLTKDIYLYHIGHGIRAGRKAARGELYELEEKISLPELTPEERNYLEWLILDSGTKITKTTMEEILSLLLLAEAENQTVEKLAQIIRDKFEIFTPWRARMIARTESAKAENWAELEGYKQDEYIELKGWLSARVPNSRQEHIDADDFYETNPIALDEPFIVGGEKLMYPGDPAGSPGNVINCLCSIYPRARE